MARDEYFPPVRLPDVRYSVAALRAPDRLKLANGAVRTVDDNVVVAKGVVPFLHIANASQGRVLPCMVLHQREPSTRTLGLVCLTHEAHQLAA